MSSIRVKICGLNEPAGLDAAVSAGARYLGLNFFPPSPRYVTPEQAATLVADVPPGVARVALTVNADDRLWDDILSVLPADMLQLHGAESPDRVAELKARYGLPVMKALGVADTADLPRLAEYEEVADQILVDAKPPKDAPLPGGMGVPFDWRLIAGRAWKCPWMLAGGLTPGNVAEAIRLTGARQVDVSSGVETAPGVKSAELIRAFIAAADRAGE